MKRRVSLEGLDLIKHFEGCRLKAYRCSAGVWTIGYGSTFYEDGSKVQDGDTISQERAEELLLNTLEYFEDMVSRRLHVSVTQHEFDASVSFAFNTKHGSLDQAFWFKAMNNGERENAANAMASGSWIYVTLGTGPNGQSAKYMHAKEGLYRRRLAEALLIRGLEWRWLTSEEVKLKTVPREIPSRTMWKDEMDPERSTSWRDVLNRAMKLSPLKPRALRPLPGVAELSEDTLAIEDVPYGLDPDAGLKPMHESRRFWGTVISLIGHSADHLGRRLAAVSAPSGAVILAFADTLNNPVVYAAIVGFVVWYAGRLSDRYGWEMKLRGEREARQGTF